MDVENLQSSICITVPPDTPVRGEIGKMDMPAGRFAVARFEIGGDEFQQAWNHVYGEWLPKCGYPSDDGPCFEEYHYNPAEHPEHKHIVDICVPVKPLEEKKNLPRAEGPREAVVMHYSGYPSLKTVSGILFISP
jgi:AraC family transcriptional regulator